jgi:hypothetical protein
VSRHPDHERVEKLVLGRTLTKERDEALSDVDKSYAGERERERMRKIVGGAFDCGAVAAMKAILEDSGIDPKLLTDPGDVA